MFRWVFGKHVPPPPSPERAVLAGRVVAWQVPEALDALAAAGIRATASDDGTNYLYGLIDSTVQLFVMEPDKAAAAAVLTTIVVPSDTPFLRPILPADAADQAFLRSMLEVAVFVGDAEPAPSAAALDVELAHYVSGFGDVAGDRGWIAEAASGSPLGAAWARLLGPRGYGFVDESTPELTIAVSPTWRGRGIGTALIDAVLGDGPVSLSVDPRNPASEWYERLGFVTVGERDQHPVMYHPGHPPDPNP